MININLLKIEEIEGPRFVSNKTVTAKKEHRCEFCWDVIKPGEKCKTRVEVDYNMIKRIYFCSRAPRCYYDE